MSAAYDLMEPSVADEDAVDRPLDVVGVVPRIAIDIFWETPEIEAVAEKALVDRRLARTRVSVQEGSLAAASAKYRSTISPELVIVESSAERRTLFAELDRLADVCVEATRVIVVGHANDVGFYRDLIDAGVSDYLVAPLEPLRLIDSIAKLYRDADSKPLARVVAFVGAKGGSGASTVAHNVARAIADRYAQQTLLIDLDLPFGTAALNFQQEDARTLGEAIDDLEALDELKLERLMTSVSETLTLLNAPANLTATYEATPAAFEHLIDLARRTAAIVLLDLPHVWSEWSKTILLAADEIVIVAEPELANFRNLKNLHELAVRARPNDKPPKLVLNKVKVPKRPEITGKDLGNYLETTPIAEIPFDAKTFTDCANAGKMLADAGANAKLLTPFETIATAVSPWKSPSNGKPSGLAALFAWRPGAGTTSDAGRKPAKGGKQKKADKAGAKGRDALRAEARNKGRR